ncbi:unnamed protein product [Rhodiola kirilowii]
MRAKEEATKKEAEFNDRLRAIEEMVRGGGGPSGHGANISGGVSFAQPTL